MSVSAWKVGICHLLAAMATFVSGCQNGRGGLPMPPKPTDTPPDAVEARWPFWPTVMNIHPLTRIAIDRATGARVLEARIEFLDQFQTTTRGYGQIRLELTDLASVTPESLTDVWSIDLRDINRNVTHFDDVTRTYLFRLQLDDANVAARPELRVYFYGSDGAALKDRRVVRPYVLEPDSETGDGGEDTMDAGADDTEPDAAPGQ